MEFEHFILIDSKDRNHTVDTNPAEYTIKFGITDMLMFLVVSLEILNK